MSGPHIPQAPEGVDLRKVTWVVLATAAVCAVAILVALWMLPPPGLRVREIANRPDRPVAPEVDLHLSRLRYSAEGQRRHDVARRRLDALEWVDRDAGVARVPVDVAVDLYLADPERPR